MLRDMLRQDGHAIGRKHVATLMKRMNIEAVYKKPTPAGAILLMRSIRTCCATWKSVGQIMSLRQISLTFR